MGDPDNLANTWHKKHLDEIARAQRRKMAWVFASGLVYGGAFILLLMQGYVIDKTMERIDLYFGQRQDQR